MHGATADWIAVLTMVGFTVVTLGVPVHVVRNNRTLVRGSLIAMLLGVVTTEALQWLIGWGEPVSFPSGHMVLLSIALSTAAMHHRTTALLLLPLAALVAFGRIALGDALVDVAAGCTIGLGLGMAAAGLSGCAPTDPWRWRWLLWPQLGFVVAITLLAYTGTLSGAWWLVPGSDKILHFLLFGALAFGTHFLVRGRSWHHIPLAIAIPLVAAVAEEMLQSMSPHRTADPIDLLADLLGLFVFWRLAVLVTRNGPARHSQP